MDVPLGVRVYCDNMFAGYTTNLVLDPAARRLTHLVVLSGSGPRTKRLVGIEHLYWTDCDRVDLRCTCAVLDRMQDFDIPYEIEADTLGYDYVESDYLMSPHSSLELALMSDAREAVPRGAIAIRRRTPVLATDGQVGWIDGLKVEAETGYITHLVLREKRIHFEKDATIPIWEVKALSDDGVKLHFSKEMIADSMHVRVRRRSDKQPSLNGS